MTEEQAKRAYEAEMAFLGSLLLSRDQLMLSGAVPVQAFLRPAHRVIARAAYQIISKGCDVDILSLRQEIPAQDLKEAGGEDYLLEIAEFVPSPSNWQTYADTALELAEKRAIEDKCQRILRMVNEDADLGSIRDLHDSQPKVLSGGRAPIRSLSSIELDDDDALEGITTGFVTLDGAIGTKGYPKGQMSIVSAYHKGGKSTFMLSSFIEQAQQGHRVLYATFADLNSTRLKRRALRNLSGFSRTPTQNLSNLEEFNAALWQINNTWDAWFYDATSLRSGYDVETFCRWLEVNQDRYKFDCVFVDYAQKLTSSSRKANSPLSEQDICSGELSRCFERTGIAGVVGSQITEGNQERRAITKGSRKWEEDAAWVLRIGEESETTKMIEIPYSRFGKQSTKGRKVEFLFDWSLERLRFEDRAE